jgi:hypothetical protein
MTQLRRVNGDVNRYVAGILRELLQNNCDDHVSDTPSNLCDSCGGREVC